MGRVVSAVDHHTIQPFQFLHQCFQQRFFLPGVCLEGFGHGGAGGGKGSDEHKAAVVGDTVGDPFKDTSGPSINILIKLLSMVSIVFAALVFKFHIL